MKTDGIHRTVLKRLLVVSAALSVGIGAVVFYLGMRQAEGLVLRLALEEARSLDHLNRLGAEHDLALKRVAEEFLERHFVLIKFYDRDKREVLQAVLPGTEAIVAELQTHAHVLPLSGAPRHAAAFVGERVLVHLMLPLGIDGGTPTGYFEGVYQVDDATVKSIRNSVLGALALVVLTTLAASTVLYPIIISLNRGLIQHANNLLKGNIELMQVLGTAIALRDSDTGTHNHRVTLYTVRLAEASGLDRVRICRLIAGAFLHDVGKIGVSDTILLKHGRHSEEESRIMRTHVPLGVDILSKSGWLQNAHEVVECHHERYDGSGYPRGLQEEAIPLGARIFAIADVFDALVSRRPYKEPFGFDEAMRLLAQGRGRHFDPTLLDVFARIARAAYDEINGADEVLVISILDEVVKRYFLTDPGVLLEIDDRRSRADTHSPAVRPK
ncbi:MAG: HD domain-containing phosphohydrolase [Candidatus Manganitrophaceae bacterium]